MPLFLFFFFYVWTGMNAYPANNISLKIIDLRCEYLSNPLGIDVLQPRLSWKLKTVQAQRGQQQTAFHILVASSPAKLEANQGDLWDSGKILSSQSTQVSYRGQRLTSGTACYWKVRVWDKDGQASSWSEAAHWSMGLLQAKDWNARWIGSPDYQDKKDSIAFFYGARRFRKEFQTDTTKRIKRATAYISGLGFFNFYFNGQKVGDKVLEPGFTEYEKEVLYVTYDLTSVITSSRNTLGILLGNGKYHVAGKYKERRKHIRGFGTPRMICQVKIEYTDGSIQEIDSDTSWRTTWKGPILESNEYDGEIYDARRELTGWNMPGYDDTGWEKAVVLPSLSAKLAAKMIPSSRVIESLSPVSVHKLKRRTYVFDLGQNIAGWARLKTKRRKGQKVTMRFAELLKEDGRLDVTNLRATKATDIYIAKGRGTEQYEPHFTSHGFRYIEVTGLSPKPDSGTITGQVVHDDLHPVGTFETGDTLVNRIYKNARWSAKSSYHSIPFDCPQRDERQGWLGDRAEVSGGESFMFEIPSFYTRWLHDIQLAQTGEGQIPNVVPTYWKVYRDNMTWPIAYPLITHLLYKHYGDTTIVQRHYASLKQWTHYMQTKYLREGIMGIDQYGDWGTPLKINPPGKNQREEDKRLQASAEILATSHFYHHLQLMQDFAILMQRPQEAKGFQNLATTVKKQLREKYLSLDTLNYGNHTMTEIVLWIAYNLVTPEEKEILLKNLEGMIQGQYHGHGALGIVGLRWLMRVLTDNGRQDLAYQLVTNTTYPGWGYMVKNGATTMWESWHRNHKSSHNHLMLTGDLILWFYEYVAGIKADIKRPGFKHILMKPTVWKELSPVKATYTSLYGKIESNWKIEGDDFYWNIAVPVNTTATVYVPARGEAFVWESGRKASEATGVQFVCYKNNRAVYTVSSGRYIWVSKEFRKNIPAHTPPVPSPSIHPLDTVLTYPARVKVSIQSTEAGKTYYTTDGSTPDENSTRYIQPFEVDTSCRIQAVTILGKHRKSFVHNSMIHVYDSTKNGWNYAYYEDDSKTRWQKVPDYDTLEAKKTGKVSLFDFDKIKMRKHFWGVRFRAFIHIPVTGEYIFYVASDDGTKLYIDDQLIVTNDGIHYTTQHSGKVTLKAGKYPIRIDHFNYWSFHGLLVQLSGPGYPKQTLPLSFITFE